MPSATRPLLSCLLVTRDRPAFAALAVRWYTRQTWAPRELVVVDGGTHPNPLPCDRYLHAPGLPLGTRRNLAVGLAKGEILATWDDDDWFAPERLAVQVAALAEGTGLCALTPHHVLDLDGRRTLALARRRPGPLPVLAPALGTLAWRREATGPAAFAAHPPNEDLAFLHAAQNAGARLRVLSGRDLWAQGQHRGSTTRVLAGRGRSPFGPGPGPAGMTNEDREALWGAAADGKEEDPPRAPG